MHDRVHIDEAAMLNKLPLKPRAKSVRIDETIDSIDWLALWAISLGVCSVVIAMIAFFTAGDKTGAAFVLIGTAALIAVILNAGARGYL
jgi:hypothetical protein